MGYVLRVRAGPSAPWQRRSRAVLGFGV